MLHNSSRLLIVVLLGSAATLGLSGCESSGGVRLGAVGSPGADNGSGSTDGGAGTGNDGSGGGSAGGSSGGTGTGSGAGSGVGGSGSGGAGATGGTGSGSSGGMAGGETGDPGGSGGTGGSQSGSGLLSNVALPGLVGPDGVADTGLLANSGNPSNPGAVGAVLVTAGNAVLGVNGQTPAVVQAVDGAVPGSVPIAGTVSKLLGSTGQALVDTGQGRTYLVDGVTAAVGQTVSLNVLDKGVLPASGAPLIGASVLSNTQNAGTLATVGVDTAGKLVNAVVTPLGAGDATVVTALVPGTTGLAGATGSVVDTATGALNNTVTQVASTVGNATSVLGNAVPANGLVTAGVADATILNGGSSPAIAVGVATPSTPTGTAATVQVLTPPSTVASVVAPVATNVVAGVVNTVTDVTSGLTSAVPAPAPAAANPVTQAVGGLLGGLRRGN